MEREFDKAFEWFCYLSVPAIFKGGRRHHCAKQSLCWLKPEAEWLLDKVRYAAWLLTEAGMPIRCIKTRNPGPIIWEDDDQIVSVPGKVRVPRAV